MLHSASKFDGFFGMTKASKIYIRFGTWNVRSLYRAGSLKPVASQLTKYNLDLVASTRGQMGGRQSAEDYIFFHGNGIANHLVIGCHI
jgi:hypothetical protein